MIRRLITLIIAIVLIAGCQDDSNRWMKDIPTASDDIIPTINWLNIPKDSIGVPTNMVKIGNKLILADSDNGFALKVYDIPNNIFTKILRIGRAEKEVLDIHQLFEYEGHLGVVDILTKKLLLINTTDYSIVSRHDISDFSAVLTLNDTLIGTLSNGIARYGKIALDEDIEEITGFGDYSEYGLSNSSGWGLLQGHLASDGKGLIGSFGYYTGVYQIVNHRTRSVIKSEVVEMSSFNNHGQLYTTMTPKSKVSFISVTGDENGICALYDGKELSYYMRSRGEKTHGNTLVRLDWNGTPISKYRSSLPISCIYTDNNNLYICALNNDGEYRIGYVQL